MKIETKFNIGDEVYFIHDNKVDSSFIVKRKWVCTYKKWKI